MELISKDWTQGQVSKSLKILLQKLHTVGLCGNPFHKKI